VIQMKKNKPKTIGEMTGSRRVWLFNPIVKVVPSGKAYKRNKRVKESENNEQNIILTTCI